MRKEILRTLFIELWSTLYRLVYNGNGNVFIQRVKITNEKLNVKYGTSNLDEVLTKRSLKNVEIKHGEEDVISFSPLINFIIWDSGWYGFRLTTWDDMFRVIEIELRNTLNKTIKENSIRMDDAAKDKIVRLFLDLAEYGFREEPVVNFATPAGQIDVLLNLKVWFEDTPINKEMDLKKFINELIKYYMKREKYL